MMAVSAQERVWDAALDWYEQLCGKCARWREQIARGASVPRDSLTLMMKELASVKENLREARGRMTPGQRLRFETIHERFTSGWMRRETGSSLPTIRVETPPLAVVPAADIPVSPLPEGVGVPVNARAGGQSISQKLSRAPVSLGFIAGITAGVYPDFSVGGLAGITLNDWGLFLKGRSNFRTQRTTYDCRSDGTTAEGYFWSGNEKTTLRHQLTLDVSYVVARPVSLYLGAGYGVRTLCWMDSAQSWARVSDRSFRGLALEAGVLLHPIARGRARGLTFLLGGSRLHGDFFDAEAGLCWRF